MLEIDSCQLGDSAQLMTAIPDNTFDLTVTSPPYDKIRTYGGHSFDFQDTANQLFRTTKDGGVVCWVVKDQRKNGNYSGSAFKQALSFQSIGFSLYDFMIYQKLAPSPPQDRYYNDDIEYILVLSKGRLKTFNPIKDHKNKTAGMKHTPHVRNADGSQKIKAARTTGPFSKRGKVWSYYVGLYHSTTDKIAFMHPATMPEKLAKDLIVSFSNEKDLVFDPFAGSGTTLKMAKLHRRQYYGIEYNQDYCEIIEKRMAKYNNTTLEDYHGLV